LQIGLRGPFQIWAPLRSRRSQKDPNAKHTKITKKSVFFFVVFVLFVLKSYLLHRFRAALGPSPAPNHMCNESKRFLVLFFKKELLLPAFSGVPA
jgi:hypothetical protein